MTEDVFEKEKIKLTPQTGFNLVGIDYFADSGNQLYLVEYFDMYQDALNAKKNGAKDITLLYCVSNYPSLIDDFNLNNIN